MGYIAVPTVTDSEELVQQALANIAALIPGWVPRDGNLEVLLLAEFARMAAEAATVASDVPDTIFRYFGSLLGIVPGTGVENQLYTTWTLIAPLGNDLVIPAGTIAGFFYQGTSYQFALVNDTTITAGNLSAANVLMQAIEPGSAYNVATTSTYLTLLTAYNFPTISTVQVSAIGGTSGLSVGVDPETDAAFLNRLAAELKLLSPRPITPSDYSLLAQNVSGVARALSLDGFNPFTNLAQAVDALPTSGTAWTGIGNGTAGATGTPQLSAAAGAVTVTTTTSAVGSTTTTGAIVGGTSMSVPVTTAVLTTSISASAPALIEIVDATNGNEVVVVYLVNGGSNKTWNFIAPPLYSHNSGVTVNVLQGVKLPAITGLNYNNPWFQSAALVQAISDVTAGVSPATPIIVSVATYSDTNGTPGSTPYPYVFSSLPQFAAGGFDYSANAKLVAANIAALNPNPSAALAASNPLAIYRAVPFEPPIVSVQSYVVWLNAGVNKTHKIIGTDLHQVEFDFAGDDSIMTPASSDYNFLPDSNLSSFTFTGGSAQSWTLPAGLTALPGYGIQYPGTGGALGSPITAQSKIFTLVNPPGNGSSCAFTAFAYVDASNVSAGSVVVNVINAATGATIATATATNGITQTAAIPFSISGANGNFDVQINIVYTGVNVPNNASIVISAIGVVFGTLTPTQVVNRIYESGYSWTPGGQYAPNAFLAPRSIVLAPIDVNGVSTSLSVASVLSQYLQSYREVNFNVFTISPNYVAINVTWTAVAMAGYDPGVVQTAGNNAIYSFLSPANWAGGTASPPYWDSTQTVIHSLDIAGILARVPGVANVSSVLISLSPTSPTSNADITLPGIAPLPVANAVLGAVSSNSLSSPVGSV